MEDAKFNFKEHVPEIITFSGLGAIVIGGSLWGFRDYKCGKLNKNQISKVLNTVSVITRHTTNAIEDCSKL